MNPFDAKRFVEPFATLWSLDRLPELGPGTPNHAACSLLQSMSVDALIPSTSNRDAAMGCISGTWLLHDFLEESHAISQDLPGVIGSYWHAIMHRREPDAGNAKYWFHKVGSHPVMAQLAVEAQSIGFDYTSPFEFIDFCERVRGSGSADELLARRVQVVEMRLLFDWCYWRAELRKQPDNLRKPIG